MTDPIKAIFEGDGLGRRSEAELILSLIAIELSDWKSRGRSEAYVLALDAAYGEGKTWFLERLRSLIALSHPVAFVDAWADDAEGEPLTAFMTAIEDALSPYMSRVKAMREHFATVRHAVLPILGRAAVGAATKLGTKLMGDGIDDAFGDVIEEAGQKTGSSPVKQMGELAETASEAVAKAGEGVISLVDRRGASVLANYRKRQRSRQVFRNSLTTLIAEISGDTNPPLFVIIDELDRCRPDYAIKVLEEIKHFFAVPNIVFIIALHGDQLAESVNAVYGSGFNSKSYLQRFFTRRYRLRRLPPIEILRKEVENWEFAASKFRKDFSPFFANQVEKLDVAAHLNEILVALNVGPREVIAVLDIIRFFARSWPHVAPINLMLLTPLAVAHIRKCAIGEVLEQANFTSTLLTHDPAGRQVKEAMNEVIISLRRMSNMDLSTFNWEHHQMKGGLYAANWLEAERAISKLGIDGRPFLSEYATRIELIGKFVDLPKRRSPDPDSDG